MVGGRHVGNVFAGQFFFDDERVDRELFRSQAREYGFEEEAYLTALDSVPLVSREALNSCMSFFTKLAGMLSKDSYGRIRLARSVAERDALLDSVSASEEQFRAMFERHKAVMLLIDPEGGAIIDGNDAAAQFYGCARDRLRALTIQDLNELPPDQVAAEYRKAAAEERNYFMFPHRAAGGETRWVDVYSAPIQVQGKNLLFSVIHDINDRERGKTEREANIELLALLNAETDLPELMKATAALFKAVSGCEAVGIRLQEAEDFPYFETTGFPDEFVEMERSLCARDECGAVLRDSQGYPIHECMCGNIINGRFDPDLPFFTLRGSFWTNCTTDLLASSSEADRQARTRNRCNGEGYESVALLPLRAGGETFGLVQLNDHRPGCFTSHSIRMMENLVSTVASGLAERRSRERAVRQTRLVDGINRIFREALGSATEEILGELCLAEAQELTESKIGFIGEIGSDGLLHDVAMSNPAWVACGMTSPAGHRRLPGDFKLHDLYGRVLLEGRGFFTNDPLSHPDHVAFPRVTRCSRPFSGSLWSPMARRSA